MCHKFFLDFQDFTKVSMTSLSSLWESDLVKVYTHSVKSLSGAMFGVLCIAILNYGTKLETAISNSQEQVANQRRRRDGRR